MMLSKRTKLLLSSLVFPTAILVTFCGCPSAPSSGNGADNKVAEKPEPEVAIQTAPPASKPISEPEPAETPPSALPDDAANSAMPIEGTKNDEAAKPVAAEPPADTAVAAPPATPEEPPLAEPKQQATPPEMPEPDEAPSVADVATMPAAQDTRPEVRVNPLRNGGAGQQEPKELAPPAKDAEPVDNSASAHKPERLGKNREPFDPIKENGQFFVGWPNPKLAIVITGRQDGYLEPCGCAGKDRMKGGLMRRNSLFQQLRNQRGWPTVGLDVGGMIKGFGRQAEMKFMTTVEALRMMKYDAMALGADDLKLPAEQLFSVVANNAALPSPFLSANVGIFGFAHGMSATHRVVEQGGIRLGVTSVLGKKYQEEIHNSDVELRDPEEALAEIVPALQESCDVMVLLAYATIEESEALAKKFPAFDVVVTGGGPPEPPLRPEIVEGTDTMLVEVGTKGMAAIVLGIYGGDKPEIRYQRVIIDSRYPDSQQVKALFAAYQDQLREAGLSGLGIRPAPHPAAETLGRFVGSQKCESCHEESYDVWKKSGHSDAWKTLVKADPPRNFDPECIACHVVGWNPTYYFPYEGGFLSEAKTPELVDVGCESCHGPGEAHVRAEMGNDKELQKKFQKAAVLTVEEAKDRHCANCHDLDNSPDFNFDTYWPLVEHHEDWGDEEEN